MDAAKSPTRYKIMRINFISDENKAHFTVTSTPSADIFYTATAQELIDSAFFNYFFQNDQRCIQCIAENEGIKIQKEYSKLILTKR